MPPTLAGSWQSLWLGLFILLMAYGRCGASPASPLEGTSLRVLPNGLRLVLREQHQAPLVAADIWVRAGSGSEAPAEEGAAHFIEHLIFKGTPTRGPGQIDEVIEDMGATLRAGTGRDAAHFYVTVPTTGWTSALEVLADALRNAAFRPVDVERERAVILDEIALDRASGRRQAVDHLYETLFQAHGYNHPTDGTADAVRRLSRDGVAAFWRRLYVPANVTVVLVGDLAMADAEAVVSRLFGGWAGSPPAPAVVAPVPPESRRLRAAASEGAMTALGCRLDAPTTVSQVCAADLAAALLGDPRAGWLARTIVAGGAGTEAAARYTPLRDGALFALYASPSPGRADETGKALAEALDRLAREGVTADEVEWARRAALGAWLYDTETYEGQARLLGTYDCIAGYEMAVQYADAMRGLKAGEVNAFAARLASPSVPEATAGKPERQR